MSSLRAARRGPHGRAPAGPAWLGLATLLAPTAIVLGLVVALAASHGGFAATAWYPAALSVLAVVVVTLLLAPPTAAVRSRLLSRALIAYGAFCAWSYLSILWSDVPGQAWDGANRILLYGLVFALVTMRPWPVRIARLALAAAVLAIAGVAVATLLATAHGDPSSMFLEGRLSSPFGYANANADFWLVGLWPALWLACDPELTWPLRGLALGIAGLLLEVALLSQSRGALIGFGLTFVFFVVLIPRRWWALAALGSCVLAGAASWSALTHVHDVHRVTELGPAVTDARRAIVLSVITLALAGAAAAFADRHVIGPWLARRPGSARAGDRALATLAALAVVGALIAIGNPVDWTRARYHDFKTSGYSQVDTGASRFNGSLGSNRYDFYRVALNQFVAHPLTGIGADSFGPAYLRERRSGENPAYAHSLGFGLLSDLGIVGTALFVVFLVGAVTAVLRVRRRAVAGAGVAVGAASGFAMFLLHGMADWLWQFPALGMIAFALLGLGARVTDMSEPLPPTGLPQEEVARARHPYGRMPAVGARLVLALLALLAGVSLALPGIAARLTKTAYDVSASDPQLAVRRLDRARTLNFLRGDAALAQGLIAQALGQTTFATTDFQRALSREPDNWFAYLELAITGAGEGRRDAALRDVQRAARLNPRQPVIAQVRAAVIANRPIDPAEVNFELNAQLSAKLKPTG